MTGCGIGADHLSFGKSFSRWQWVSMMLKALAKAKWLLVLLKFEIYVGGRAKICICAFHSPFLSLSFPLLLPPPLSSVSPLLIFRQLLTDIGAHILFCLTLDSLLLVCKCQDSHLLHLNKNKNNTFKVLTSSLKTAKKKEKTHLFMRIR